MRALGPALTAEESAALIEACRSLLGVRFRHQGRNPAIGVDCIGMLGWGVRQIGRCFQDVRGYGNEPHKNGLRQGLVTNLGEPIPRASMRAGDIPLMRLGGEPRHVGLITNHPDGGLALLHVHSELKFVSEHVIGTRFMSCIVEVFRP